jgi:integrase
MDTHDRRWQRVWVEHGIYLQPNGKYAVRVVIDGRARLRTAATTLEDAREQRLLLAEAARRGELPVFPRLTFAEAAARWLQLFEAKVAVGDRRERTLENYHYHLDKHLLPALGRRHLQSITTNQIADLIGDLQTRGLSAKTVAGSLVPLGCVFRFALRRGYIADNPLRRLEPSERPRPVRVERRVLGRPELARLLASCPTRYRPLLATAVYTGVRLSELLGLSWSDVDFAAGVIHVRHQLSRARIGSPARRVAPKTAAAMREIPLAPQLAVLLHRHKQAAGFAVDCDYVFTTSLGTPLGHRNVEVRALARAGERAGINLEGAAAALPRPAPHLREPPDRRSSPRCRPGEPHPGPREHEHHPRHLHPPLRTRGPHS